MLTGELMPKKIYFKFEYQEKALAVFLIISSFIIGLFNEWAGAICSLVFAVMLVIRLSKEGFIKIGINITTITIAVITAGFLVTTIWGVDKYYSFLGFVKFFPIILFGLYLCRIDAKSKEELFSFVPLCGAVMAVVSFVFTQFGILTDYFSVSGRISGFFQYPNTFALFLIIGLMIIAMKERLDWQHAVISAILVAGVFLTGSRTSFIVLIAAIVMLMFVSKNKGFKISVVVFVAAAVAAAGIYFAVTGKYGALGRFLTISASAGTFKGRLLYFKDAVKVIAKHPFGIGYMGYYFAQGSFQSGVYSNEFVHNELLQLLLDIGWIPAVLAVVCLIVNFFDKENSRQSKLIMLVTAVHSMLDFDLQFLTIVFILMLCFNYNKNVKILSFFGAAKAVFCSVVAVVTAFSLYFGASSLFYVAGKSNIAVKICPVNTMAQIDMLKATDNVEQKNIIADKIISVNKNVSNAYSAKALYYYSDGDVEKTIGQKELAIEKNRYFTEEYVDYCSMLISSLQAYSDMQDYESAQYCRDKLLELEEKIDDVNQSTDKIAYELQDKPDLKLPDEYVQIINDLK